MKKIALLILVLLSVLLLIVLKIEKEENSVQKERTNNQELIKFIEGADSKVYCGEYVLSYITEDKRVYCVFDDGTNYVQGWYLPNINNATAIYGDGTSYLYVLSNGTIEIYNVSEKAYLDKSQYKMIDRKLGVFTHFLAENTEKIEDIYFQSLDCIAVRIENDWRCVVGTGFELVDWGEAKQIEGNVYSPELVLNKDGTVRASQYGASGLTELTVKKVEEWQDIKEIALGMEPFGLKTNGEVITVNPYMYNAADVLEWRNIESISAASNVTAGLQTDGKVVIRSPMNDNIFQAESWENICYVKATPFYVFGIDDSGKFHFTESKATNGIIHYMEENDYPKVVQLHTETRK